MSRITTNIGLVTGLNIEDLVGKLVALQSAQRDRLAQKTLTYDQQRTALTQLTAMLIAVQLSTDRLGTASLFTQRTVNSSNLAALTATVTSDPAPGTYSFRPIQVAQSQQLQSSRFASATTPLGGGTLSFRFGGFVDSAVPLDWLNAGAGLQPGSIRVTDRSGATTDINLTYARSIDDVLRAINENGAVRVRAETHGDAIRLIDETGQSASNLHVQEVNGGSTAQSLGLAGINAAASEASGADVLALFNDLNLDKLNDNSGVRFDTALPDLNVHFRDGTDATIDFHRLAVVGTQARATTTAANGLNAQVTITAKQAGAAYSGVTVQFVNDDNITTGGETVSYDDQAKTLTFKIDEGQTTANQIVQAVAGNSAVAELFGASLPDEADGTGVIAVTDTAVTNGPPSTTTTAGSLSDNAKIAFTAVQGGAEFDGVTVQFVDNAGITAGQETVAYDDSNPSDKKLIFQIDAGHTTAQQIIDALNNDPTASQIFTAANGEDSSGSGLVSVSDTAITSGGAIIEPVSATNETTLGDVLNALNAVAPTKLHAAPSASGDRIVLTDLTTDNGGTFAVTDLYGSHAAEDLGLDTASAAESITSRRLLSGLKTTLLAKLNGGQGLGSLGALQLTDRSGSSASVDLSTAETIDDVIDAINDAGLGIVASVNSARNGILLTDTTGATASNLIVANGDGTNTADKLQLTLNAAVTTHSSGDLHRQSVSENTRLADLNGGGGVALGTVRITDTLGHAATLRIDSSVKTVGDVLAAIGHLDLALTARINDTGDGIILIDTADGAGTLTVAEGNATSARDLHLLGGEKSTTIGGQPARIIDGSTTQTITLTSNETLQDLVTKINVAAGGVRAAVFSDGTSLKPIRFTLTSLRTGGAGSLLIDGSGLGIAFDEIARAQDALLQIGSGGGIVASSSNNVFQDVLPGVTLNVQTPSAETVQVSVGTTHDSLKTTLKTFVDSFNKLHARIADVTRYDAATNQSALLQADSSVRRVDSELASLLSGRVVGAGSIQSFETIGISLKDDGSLAFDEGQLQDALDASPEGVEQFFTKATTGVAARFKKLIDQLAGVGSSTLINRITAISGNITLNGERIQFLNARLEALRLRLTNQFQQAEIAIGRIQSNQGALNTLASLAAQFSLTGSG